MQFSTLLLSCYGPVLQLIIVPSFGMLDTRSRAQEARIGARRFMICRWTFGPCSFLLGTTAPQLLQARPAMRHLRISHWPKQQNKNSRLGGIDNLCSSPSRCPLSSSALRTFAFTSEIARARGVESSPHLNFRHRASFDVVSDASLSFDLCIARSWSHVSQNGHQESYSPDLGQWLEPTGHHRRVRHRRAPQREDRTCDFKVNIHLCQR